MCLFSVVTTVYNGEKFIERAMTSVVSQTFLDYEYVIVDNGSSDRSGQLIDEIISSNPEKCIRKIYLKDNKGISGGRNEGIKNSNGKYICFLDADDYWEENKLEVVKKSIDENKNYNIFCHWEKHIHNDEVTEVRYRCVDYDNSYLDLLANGNCLSTSAMVIRKDLLDAVSGFDEKLVSGEEDYDLWLRLAKNGASIFMIEKALGCWLIRDDSVSAKHIAHTEAVAKMLEPHFNHLGTILSKNQVTKIRNKAIARLYCGCARTLSLGGMYRESRKIYFKAIQTSPIYFKSYAGVLLNIVHR